MIRALLIRELRLASRNAAGTGLTLAFMALFVVLCGLALGGAAPDLGPGLLWLAATLSALLGLDRLYQPDQASGALAQMHIAGASGSTIALSKALAFALTALLPLILIVPLLAPLMGLGASATTGVVVSLIVGLPALTAYASFTAALLAGERGGGVLGVLLTAPLLIPVLVFGIEAAQAWPVAGFSAVEIRILAGLSLIGVAVGGAGTVAAIAANRGPR